MECSITTITRLQKLYELCIQVSQLCKHSNPIEHNWENASLSFSKSQTKSQNRLHQVILDIWPSISDIHINYLHPDMEFNSQRNVELDIYIPSLRIAFEYQGEQHFT